MTQSHTVLAPEPAATPAPELERLNVFVGTWNAEGESLPDAPIPGRMSTTNRYEWLPGGFYLVDHGELRINGEPVHHLWIFGYDASNQTYPVHAYDGLGSFRVYQATVSDRTWTLTGQWERATIVFREDGNAFEARWEMTRDGDTWLPLCEVTATKAM